MGKRTPKASVMKKMWVQRILSTGSNVTTWPGGKSSSWCSWAFTKDMSEHSNKNESAAVGPASARFEAIFLDVDSNFTADDTDGQEAAQPILNYSNFNQKGGAPGGDEFAERANLI